ncbi:MAG: efflux RND transporter periplasmic adaptor subunit, partial [Blastomonas fulva]
MRSATLTSICTAILLPLAACGASTTTDETKGTELAAGEYERGPHNGRILREGDFALELTVFEDGVPPEYRLYAYRDDKPLPPGSVKAQVTIKRLDGEVTTFTFRPVEDYLRGSSVLVEPHSFDVSVRATEGGKTHKWAFASYEGRTKISDAAAKTAGIETAIAGPAEVGETLEIIGRVELDPSATSDVGAKFPGRVVSVNKNVGDRVARGALLARVE